MNILIAISELALGRARGFGRFTVSPRAFRNSFLVLFSVPALLSFLLMARHGLETGAVILLALACALLCPAVITHQLARVWDREPWWLRFAIAFNYSRIALTAIYALMLFLAAALIGAGQPNRMVAVVIQGMMVGYTLWFDWFLIRQGLQVSGARAAIGVMTLNFGTLVLVMGPLFLAQFLSPDRGGPFN